MGAETDPRGAKGAATEPLGAKGAATEPLGAKGAATAPLGAKGAAPRVERAAMLRAAVLAAAMIAAALLAVAMTPRRYLADEHLRARLEQVVPTAFGDWQVDRSIIPVPPSPDVQSVIDATYDETVARTYRNTAGQRIMLSLAYGRNQHKGMNTHRPEVCYPAQGFKVTQGGQPGVIALPDRPLEVTRLAATLGGRHEPITYWLLVGDRITPFGYAQRWVTIGYGLRGVIPDGVLVRVSSIERDNAVAFQLQERFIRDMLAGVGAAGRARLIGADADASAPPGTIGTPAPRRASGT